MKYILNFALLIAGALVLANCSGGTASPKSDDEKTIYAIAYDMGKKLQAFSLTSQELKVFNKGVADGLKDAKPEVDTKQQIVKVGDLVSKRAVAIAEKEKKAATSFLEAAAKEPGAQKTESGLIYLETAAGTGASPAATDQVKVHYHGTLRDGSVFDSSKDRGQPATFPLNGVIPCWTEGVQKMKVGGKATLVCPSELAYKDRGAPPVIKPGAALKFEVELLEIVKGDNKAPAMPAHPSAPAPAKPAKKK
jgi:FKBP-type peptidyl-prolyl cis-trans isomerase FkpA